MDIMGAIKREQRKLKKQAGNLQQQLDGVKAAAKALVHSKNHELSQFRERVLSAAGRKRISEAAKKRWARVRAQAKKAVN